MFAEWLHLRISVYTHFYALSVQLFVCFSEIMGFHGGSDSKESACSSGDLGLIPWLGRSPGEERLPTLLFLPGESHGQRSLAGLQRVRHN